MSFVRKPVDDAFVTMLETSGLQVGFCAVPGIVPKNDRGEMRYGYVVVYPVTGSYVVGAFGTPEKNVVIGYTTRAVGSTDGQAQVVGDKVRAAVMGRSANGSFTREIVGVVDTDRRQPLIGNVEPGEGGLWQVTDRFDIQIE